MTRIWCNLGQRSTFSACTAHGGGRYRRSCTNCISSSTWRGRVLASHSPLHDEIRNSPLRFLPRKAYATPCYLPMRQESAWIGRSATCRTTQGRPQRSCILLLTTSRARTPDLPLILPISSTRHWQRLVLC